MGGACGTYGEEEKRIQSSGEETRRRHLEDGGIDERIILKWTLNKQDGEGMAWLDFAQYRGKWRAVVNTVMNHRCPQNSRTLLTT
jgi:hypothetical protein